MSESEAIQPKDHHVNWKRIGRISTIIGALAIAGTAFIWVGQTSAEVRDNACDIDSLEMSVEKIEDHNNTVDVNQGVILNELKNISETLREIKADIEIIKGQ
jgi:hypothetical protein